MANNDSCKGRVALITGASRGIGLAIAQRIAAEGAAVVLVSSRLGKHGQQPGTLEEAVTLIQANGGQAVAEVADLQDAGQRADLVQRAEQHFGALDILVNNAATTKWALPSQCQLKDRQRIFEVNYNAPIDLSQQVLPGMLERGQGWILNITSSSAQQPQVPYRDSPEAAHMIAVYGSSKSALNRYTEGLAHEVAGSNVFVNALMPVAIALTEQAAALVGHIAKNSPDMAENVEVMAEAALELVTGRHVGQITYSRVLLHQVARKVRSVDGSQELGDAFLPANMALISD